MNVTGTKIITIFGVSGLTIAGLTFFIGVPQRSSNTMLQPRNSSVVEAGQAVYAANCASCHGVELEGEEDWRKPNADLTMPAPPHNERGHSWHHTDQVLFDLTKFGVAKFVKQADFKTNMPAYEGVLSDTEIIAALSYIKSTWPDEMQKRHDKLNEQSESTKK